MGPDASCGTGLGGISGRVGTGPVPSATLIGVVSPPDAGIRTGRSSVSATAVAGCAAAPSAGLVAEAAANAADDICPHGGEEMAVLAGRHRSHPELRKVGAIKRNRSITPRPSHGAGTEPVQGLLAGVCNLPSMQDIAQRSTLSCTQSGHEVPLEPGR
jgi:hypothetical protein